MTLPAFAAVRRAAAPLLLRTGACYRLISLAREALAVNQSHAAPAVEPRDRQTDGRTDTVTDGRSTIL